MFKPKKSAAHYLAPKEVFIGVPDNTYLKEIMDDAITAKGPMIKQPIRAEKGGFLLTCQMSAVAAAPTWTLYEGEGGNAVIWAYEMEGTEMIQSMLVVTCQPTPEPEEPTSIPEPVDDGFMHSYRTFEKEDLAKDEWSPAPGADLSKPVEPVDAYGNPVQLDPYGQPIEPAPPAAPPAAAPPPPAPPQQQWPQQSPPAAPGYDPYAPQAAPPPGYDPYAPQAAPPPGYDPYAPQQAPYGAPPQQPAWGPGGGQPGAPYGAPQPGYGAPQQMPYDPYAPQQQNPYGAPPQHGAPPYDPYAPQQQNPYGAPPQPYGAPPQNVPYDPYGGGGQQGVNPWQQQQQAPSPFNPGMGGGPGMPTSAQIDKASVNMLIEYIDKHPKTIVSEMLVSDVLPGFCVDAAMKLQEMVCTGKLDDKLALEVLKMAAQKGGVIDEAMVFEAKEKQRSAVSDVEVQELLTTAQLSDAQPETIEAAKECVKLINEGRIQQGKAIIALHYIQRARGKLMDALDELSIELLP